MYKRYIVLYSEYYITSCEFFIFYIALVTRCVYNRNCKMIIMFRLCFVLYNLPVTFGGMASLFLGCSLVTLIEIIYIVYKSLLMLKYKSTKVRPVSNKQELCMVRRHCTNQIRKPLYKAPSHKNHRTFVLPSIKQ